MTLSRPEGSNNRRECAGTSDEIARWFPAFPELEELWLAGSQATDEAMDFVGRLPRLKKLMMWNVQVSDEGVARLKDLKELRYIHIDDARIGDASLAVLATLLRLEGMASLGNDFTDQGLASLQEMTQLREFVIRLDGLPKDASWGCVWEFDPKATGWAGGAAGYEQGKQAGELGMVFRHAAQGREPSEGPSRHRDGAMGDGGREGRQATMPVC